MAEKKGGLDLQAILGSMLSRLPFVKRAPPPSPEPFDAIEDDTPINDVLSSTNAAPIPGAGLRGGPDVKEAVASIIKKPAALAAIGVVLVFLLVLAITAIVVGSPPEAAAAPEPFTAKGQALVKTWILPDGDPLEQRMALERDGRSPYTSADAARVGIDPDPAARARLAQDNDEAIDDLLATVP